MVKLQIFCRPTFNARFVGKILSSTFPHPLSLIFKLSFTITVRHERKRSDSNADRSFLLSRVQAGVPHRMGALPRLLMVTTHP